MSWRPPDPWSYSYLLGMYLGDGCISATSPRSYQLVVVCDAAYPAVIEDCCAAIMLTMLPQRLGRRPHAVQRCVRVSASSDRWPEVFPQHGPGRKHERRIELLAWQREVVDRFPQEFLRGLLHPRWLPDRQTASRLPLRVLRSARGPVDAVEPAQHLGGAPPQRRAARLVRPGEVVGT